MANNLPITELTEGQVIDNQWTGNGVFDVLLNVINKNIELQYENGRIVGKEYADVYLGGVQATLQQSIEFLLRKELVYWQVEVAQKELEIKQLEVGIREKELALAELALKEKYIDRVIKDKEAAKLGLDNVVKNMEEKRLVNPNMVYVPQYVEII